MFKEFFQLHQIGKELGLNKKEIKKTFLFGNSKYSVLYTILLILSIVAFGILMIILGMQAYRNTYPSGSYYSTVKKKDFKRRRRIYLRILRRS